MKTDYKELSEADRSDWMTACFLEAAHDRVDPVIPPGWRFESWRGGAMENKMLKVQGVLPKC